MARFALRPLTIVVVLAAVAAAGGCGATRPAPPAEPDESGARLYDDAFIRSLAPYDIDATWRQCGGIFRMPSLGVVPPGEGKPRREVFARLGLDEDRMGRPRDEWVMNVAWVTWRVSPSYDLVCMTALNDPDWPDRDFLNPDRPVYGVRLAPHSPSPK